MNAYSGLHHSDQWHRQTVLSSLLKCIKSVPIYSVSAANESPSLLWRPQEWSHNIPSWLRAGGSLKPHPSNLLPRRVHLDSYWLRAEVGRARLGAQEGSIEVKTPEFLPPLAWEQEGTNKGTVVLQCHSSVTMMSSRGTAVHTFNALDRGLLMYIRHIKNAEYKQCLSLNVSSFNTA